MAVPYGDFGPERVKHLEMLQVVIARLNGNSFLVKGSAGTLVTALCGFAVSSESAPLAALALLPALGLWLLDSYFLRAERLFRCLYDAVSGEDVPVAPFFMSATSKKSVDLATELELGPDAGYGWLAVIFSPTLGLFYGLLVAVSGALTIALHCS